MSFTSLFCSRFKGESQITSFTFGFSFRTELVHHVLKISREQEHSSDRHADIRGRGLPSILDSNGAPGLTRGAVIRREAYGEPPRSTMREPLNNSHLSGSGGPSHRLRGGAREYVPAGHSPVIEDIMAYKNSIWTQAVGTL